MRTRAYRYAVLVGVAAVALAACEPRQVARDDPTPGVPRLVTNEYAYRHPDAPDAVLSEQWRVTSGSLYAVDTSLWSGKPDGGSPDAGSTNATGSAVLRAVTTRDDYEATTVRFDLNLVDFVETDRTPPQNFDGVHVFLRYQSPQTTYYVSVLRRDGKLAIKKKTEGGPTNGGTYATLATAPAPETGDPPLPWRRIEVEVHTEPGAHPTVHFALSLDGVPALTAVDDARDGRPAILAPGRTGVRGDNCEFFVREFTVSGDNPIPTPSTVDPTPTVAPSPEPTPSAAPAPVTTDTPDPRPTPSGEPEEPSVPADPSPSEVVP